MTGRVLAVTGTSTDVGKTIVTAALAAAVRAEGTSTAVCKPAQTGVAAGESGDLAVIRELAGELATAECARYPEPLAPATAARRASMPQVRIEQIDDAVAALSDDHDLTLVEGAGGILVRIADDLTLLDVALRCGADVLVVVPAGLGVLNHAELTVDAVRAAGLRPAGLVIGSWPQHPDLAMTCNRTDLPELTGVPVVGVIPAGAGALDPTVFRADAASWFDDAFLRTLVRPTALLTQSISLDQGVHP